MSTFKWEGRVALVTGAASGIGRAIARALGAQGCRLVLCDIDEAGLNAISDEVNCIHRSVVDVGDPEAMQAFAEEVHRQVPAVDILVNNAGIAVAGRLVDVPLEDWRKVVDVNLYGVIHGCHYFVPPMVQQQRGHIVNIASAAGFVAATGMSAYAMTKFGVVGLSESLRRELGPEGVGVSTICPGFIATNIMDGARMHGFDETPGLKQRLRSIVSHHGAPVELVAAAVLDAVAKNKGLVPVTTTAWALFYGKRVAPGLIDVFDRFVNWRLNRP